MEIVCKLCGVTKEPHQISSADKKMCRKCHSDVVRYKRLKDKGGATEVHDIVFMDRITKMFKSNISAGRYVPKAYYATSKLKECVTCLQSFKTTSGSNICSACQKKERAYRSLIARGKETFTLAQYDDDYRRLHTMGRVVPKIVFERVKGLV